MMKRPKSASSTTRKHSRPKRLSSQNHRPSSSSIRSRSRCATPIQWGSSPSTRPKTPSTPTRQTRPRTPSCQTRPKTPSTRGRSRSLKRPETPSTPIQWGPTRPSDTIVTRPETPRRHVFTRPMSSKSIAVSKQKESRSRPNTSRRQGRKPSTDPSSSRIPSVKYTPRHQSKMHCKATTGVHRHRRVTSLPQYARIIRQNQLKRPC